MSNYHLSQVEVWEETVCIPTYETDKPNKNPMFLEKRVYQGSSGVVYPFPVIDRVFDYKVDKDYKAIFLENEYLKIMLLPELGGRVQMALDKTNNYHFIYYNRVIKPALVGLTGPWISGGIEFNWPQHHRPSTFDPVEYWIQSNDNGSQTVWMGEIERMSRTKGMAEFTLYPDKAYLEINVQLYNRTTQPQTFLWWANPAVHVNDDYQSVFPPDVHAVMDHGKRDVSSFPIATGTYYKMDYSPGTDISWYKNIPVPTSYMAYHSDFDFLGCYDHGQQAGMMHVANHHVVPGKKQWTWGNGDFGQAWDRQLTDEDGPYIELMCGAYTDNQPDFSWLQPGEEKRFTQIFMPYKSIGAAKNANKDAVINLEIEDRQALLGVYVTSPRQVRIQLSYKQDDIFNDIVMLSPEVTFTQTVSLPKNVETGELTLRVLDNDEQDEIITFTPLPEVQYPIPEPASPARPPEEIASNDELYLNGLHLEQYRHVIYRPEPYYLEALKRDPGDSRCNNAMGLLLYRRGQFTEAEDYFRRAVERLTQRNPNPYNGEPHYNLGLVLKMQGKYQLAKDAFYKATWNAAWQDSAYYELAKLASRNAQFDEALDLLARALDRNTCHHKARHLKIAVLRKLERQTEAKEEIATSLKLDRLNLGAYYEQYFLEGSLTYQTLMRGDVQNYIEISLDYADAGLFEEACELLGDAPDDYPMTSYYLAWYNQQAGYEGDTLIALSQAAQSPPDYCFPNRIECVPVLKMAMGKSPDDARASYYLGNFLYAHRRYDEAIANWESSHSLDLDFPTVCRNLGLAYVNKRDDLQNGLAFYEQAFQLDPADARVFFELDQLQKKVNQPVEQRLTLMEANRELVDQRDDLTIEFVTLLNLSGRNQDALDILTTRRFHPWEGGEGKVSEQYVLSLVELAKQELHARNFQNAIEYLQRTQPYPLNLGEGRLANAQHNHVDYYLGCAYEGLRQNKQARSYFLAGTEGISEPASAIYYNDQPPDMIFYQGRAHQKLDQQDKAHLIFQKLIDYGRQHFDDEVTIDYFAVSLPNFLVFDEDLNKRNCVHCHYMMALGYMGLGDVNKSTDHFNRILAEDASHIGANIHRGMVNETP